MPDNPPPPWVLTRQRAIGVQIREARRQADLTQIQLGDRIGRDHKTISRWENAVSTPDLRDLVLLAHALDVTLADLVR
ncbi:Helix-turn-helix [Streptomyces sp. cf386]|uniref:helix-turn-helix domain-containing protein n=1 Tax=Streptomyces sp. cf386 TaxID=1761904 RepID=UPI000880827E|nr:helix-turn-helix transcriptional regulator [Streptomyces sp. cf386]SDM45895.1 Helix-turn-helix [Streptomyces sp. cf386]